LDTRNRNHRPQRIRPPRNGVAGPLTANRQQSPHRPCRDTFGGARRNYERYLALAREAVLMGDTVVMENCYQHASIMFRVMREEGRPRRMRLPTSGLSLLRKDRQSSGQRSGEGLRSQNFRGSLASPITRSLPKRSRHGWAEIVRGAAGVGCNEAGSVLGLEAVAHGGSSGDVVTFECWCFWRARRLGGSVSGCSP
jgi:hypothetical protein